MVKRKICHCGVQLITFIDSEGAKIRTFNFIEERIELIKLMIKSTNKLHVFMKLQVKSLISRVNSALLSWQDKAKFA
jgi:predicted phosphoadenosine phosphosulfate sulfurtransferase